MDSVDTPLDILPIQSLNDTINKHNDQQHCNHPTLDVCNQVRKLLVENGIELTLDFPIMESEKGGIIRDNHYLGYANMTRKNWEQIDNNHMVSRTNIIHSVEVCLTDPRSQESYALLRVLPTLLHEFAHCITPLHQTYGESPDGKQKRRWHYDAHDDYFYDNFSKILDVAERVGIYKLPSGFSKHNRQSLRRFDAVDVDGKNVFIGQTTLFKQLTHPPDMAIPQKLTVTNDKGETKLIVLKGEDKERMVEELREACMKKFQVKKKKAVLKFFTLSGESLETSEDLYRVADNGQIVFKIT